MKPSTLNSEPAAGRDRRAQLAATGVSFCGTNAVTCAGETFTPDADLAYFEFHICTAFPAIIPSEKWGVHPQVIANSFASLKGKVVNLNHMMKSYDPDEIPHDYTLGAIMAVEFPAPPEGGWKIGPLENAPSIRAVGSLFKAAHRADKIIEDWFEGRTPLGENQQWTVSMENSHKIGAGGFLIKAVGGGRWAEGEAFATATPEDLAALGWVYVPAQAAPLALLECLNNDDDDVRDQNTCTRVCRDYLGQETLFLIGGLNGRITFNGLGLCPLGKEPGARIARMFASAGQLLDTDTLFGPLHALAEAFLKKI